MTMGYQMSMLVAADSVQVATLAAGGHGRVSVGGRVFATPRAARRALLAAHATLAAALAEHPFAPRLEERSAALAAALEEIGAGEVHTG